jgi:hypothetical protein
MAAVRRTSQAGTGAATSPGGLSSFRRAGSAPYAPGRTHRRPCHALHHGVPSLPTTVSRGCVVVSRARSTTVPRLRRGVPSPLHRIPQVRSAATSPVTPGTSASHGSPARHTGPSPPRTATGSPPRVPRHPHRARHRRCAVPEARYDAGRRRPSPVAQPSLSARLRQSRSPVRVPHPCPRAVPRRFAAHPGWVAPALLHTWDSTVQRSVPLAWNTYGSNPVESAPAVPLRHRHHRMTVGRRA